MWKEMSHQLSQKEKSRMNTKCMKVFSFIKNYKLKLLIGLAKITKIDKTWNWQRYEINTCSYIMLVGSVNWYTLRYYV